MQTLLKQYAPDLMGTQEGCIINCVTWHRTFLNTTGLAPVATEESWGVYGHLLPARAL